jgi:hypothetical protein
MAATLVTSRLCKCSCGERFTPNPKRPGQEYKYGHKPKDEPSVKRLGVEPPREKERALLDYRLTVATLRREIASLDQEIEALDSAVDDARKALATFQGNKDRAVERQLVANAALEMMQGLIDGRPFADLVAIVEAS